MSSTHDHPEKSGTPTGANKPQVLVRAGKHYVCSACGTLVEIPADVVGQLVIAVDPAPENAVTEASSENAIPAEQSPQTELPRNQPPPTEPSSHEPLSVAASQQHGTTTVLEHLVPLQITAAETSSRGSTRTKPTRQRLRPARPHRPDTSAPRLGETIDGLPVPTAGQLDRAQAWVSFHLQVLDRQGTEINRLKKLLKQNKTHGVPCPRQREYGIPVTTHKDSNNLGEASQSHAHEDVHMAPSYCGSCPEADLGEATKVDRETERGPP